MSSFTFNEFQRELKKRNVPQDIAYVLTAMYERLGELAQQQDEMARLLVTFANTVERSVKMQQCDQALLSELGKRAGLIGKTPGVDVKSIANEPE